jgi:uncharacterized damage-inducible protein DinB
MRVAALSLLALALPSLALAQADVSPADAAKADYLMVYDETAKKLKDLAAAIPEGKYGWSPAKEVRTVGQVVGHVAGAQYLFARVAGADLPADAPKDENGLENLKSKAEYVAALDEALAFGRQWAAHATPEDLAKQVDFFGNKMSVRGLFLVMHGHLSEHLGQLIAYARSVGVTPPWSK